MREYGYTELRIQQTIIAAIAIVAVVLLAIVGGATWYTWVTVEMIFGARSNDPIKSLEEEVNVGRRSGSNT
jgi:hypothetical protein